MRAVSVVSEVTDAGATRAPGRSFAESLRTLPVAIQGLWVGLVCIVLLVSSAAALRSLFAGNVGAAPSRPAPVLPTAPLHVTSAPPVTAPPVATPAPTASTNLSIGGPGGNGAFGALAIRDRLPAHVRLRKFGAFMDDLERLLAMDPTAIDRFDVRKLIADAAMYSMIMGPDGQLPADGQRLYKFLTTSAGPAGPDILFDLVTTRGGSRAATYAEEALRQPELRAKGTPALRIAYELRFATSCPDRVALLDRVKAEGDRRVLASLFQMARCGHGPTDCCLGNDAAYKEAVRVINSKK